MLKHLKSLKLESCYGLKELPTDLVRLVCLDSLTLSSIPIKHLPDSICMMKNLKSLKLKRCELLEELPWDLGRLVCLEMLTLESTRIKRLPYSICIMKNLKSLMLRDCPYLEELPRDLGHVKCLEKLILRKCAFLKDIPNSICNMKRLRYLSFQDCDQVENLPEEVGSLECLKELDISFTGISHLPQSISLLEGLRVIGSEEVLQSCVFATNIHTSESEETSCFIKAVDNTEVMTGSENQFTENRLNRWWLWSVVVPVLGLLVRQVIHRARPRDNGASSSN